MSHLSVIKSALLSEFTNRVGRAFGLQEQASHLGFDILTNDRANFIVKDPETGRQGENNA
jgi:hypothetical protein